MTEPAKRVDMRATMPMTADWIARKRLDWGLEHVNHCLRRGTVDKAPGFFYAIEGGQVVGTPFPADHPAAEWQQYAVVNGCGFAAFIAEPMQTSAQGAQAKGN